MGVSSFVSRFVLVFALLYYSGLLLAAVLLLAPHAEPFPFQAALLGVCLLFTFASLLFGLSLRRTLLAAAFAMIVWASCVEMGRRHTMEPPAGNGRSALVTGSTRGIGLRVAEQLVQAGWKVFVHGRSASSMEAVAKRLGPAAIALPQGADLSSFEETKAFVKLVKEHPAFAHLDVLILNAGLARSLSRAPSADGLDVLMQANCLSGALMERLLGSHTSRVVYVSSLSSLSAPTDPAVLLNLTRSLPEEWGDATYGRTKLCQVWAATCGFSQSTTVSVHPGGCRTEIGEDMFDVNIPLPLMSPWWWQHLVRPFAIRVYDFWHPVSFCSANVLYAAFSADGVTTGDFLGTFKPIASYLRHPLLDDDAFGKQMCEAIRAEIDKVQ